MTYILLLEDDHIQAENITASIRDRFEVDVRRIATEKAFIEFAQDIGSEHPVLAILDVMVRWTDPEPGMKLPPPHVRAEGSYRAGLRCLQILKEVATDVPAIIYTILEKEDLEGEPALAVPSIAETLGQSNVEPIVLRKEGDRNALLTAIAQILKN
jgi:hypothetical protein